MDMNIVHVRKDTAHHHIEKQALLLTDPACEVELTDADLETIYGGLDVPGLSGLPGVPGLP